MFDNFAQHTERVETWWLVAFWTWLAFHWYTERVAEESDAFLKVGIPQPKHVCTNNAPPGTAEDVVHKSILVKRTVRLMNKQIMCKMYQDGHMMEVAEQRQRINVVKTERLVCFVQHDHTLTYIRDRIRVAY